MGVADPAKWAPGYVGDGGPFAAPFVWEEHPEGWAIRQGVSMLLIAEGSAYSGAVGNMIFALLTDPTADPHVLLRRWRRA